MNILAPALIFTALSAKEFDLAANELLILGSVGVVLGSGLLAWRFAKLLREDPRTFVPPMMFNNCGNLGPPACRARLRLDRTLRDGGDVHHLEPAAFHARRAYLSA